MTLCITYKLQSPNDKLPRAICYTDSRITTTGAKTKQTEVGGFLPSHTEIKHQTDKGIKIQIVSALTGSGEHCRDFVFSIAGAVSLGIQSLIHLDSVFTTFYEDCDFEQYIEKAKATLHTFWQDAWDKDIEYLMTATDDNNEIRIFHVKGTKSDLVFEDLQQEDELLLGVIGDNAEEARATIRQEISSLMYAGMAIHSALDLACVRMMRRAIENQNQKFIGGNMQACLLVDKGANHMVLDDGQNLLFRGVRYSREWCKYPRILNTLTERPGFLVSTINQDMYDPQKNIQEIMENIKPY
ncbi:hypothetical protein S7335_881 [Synechococcus sp. PCC 7335]|uniref:hypothetical protein n=1 Tax=Synechococcus sp. (strain ATCC 29403 / PCC 7335) TaxID=91464 RepID=UPI00017EC498|nr:hypothetical protein [Synechococcus sp. PCC 7335]EDX82324.1 hypothetical protein S7335_881 [Synechococcus sp. PCC 7335]